MPVISLQDANPPMRNGFLERIVEHFSTKGDDTFVELVHGERVDVIRWLDLELSARTFLAAYRERGLLEGALILIFLRHGSQQYGSFVAAMLGGMVPAFMPCTSTKQNPSLYWASHKKLFDRLRPAAVVADSQTLREMSDNGLDLSDVRSISIEDLRPAFAEFSLPQNDSIAFIQHSSGTTGLKKGVGLSYRAVEKQVISYSQAIGLRTDDTIVSWLPLYHDMGFVACFIMPLYLGIPTVQLDPFEWVSHPKRMLDHIQRTRATLAWLPNFAFEHLAAMAGHLAEKYDLSSMRAFINCSEICRAETFDRFSRAFARSGVLADQLSCCYAMAEAVFAVTQTPLGERPRRIWVERSRLALGQTVREAEGEAEALELLEVGRPIGGAEILIFDEKRIVLSDGCVGEIGIRSDFLFERYNKEPERTKEKKPAEVYFTGDLGVIYSGALYILGRVDDVIIVSGRNIYAHEVEKLLSTVDGLKRGRAAALPWVEKRGGSTSLVIVAEKIATSNRDAIELKNEVLSVIFSTIGVQARSVHLVEEGWLVKTSSGKVSREGNLKKLAEQLRTQSSEM